MLRHLVIVTVLVFWVVGMARPSNIGVDKSCREHPQLVSKCFNVRGRLGTYNGAPALRIWKIGTKRVLGISEQRFVLEGFLNVPEELRGKIDQNKFLYGDFEVCPFTKPRRNEMQLVCIEKVVNLQIKEK